MSEPCARCGRVGEDRRTLWHACLYEMSEIAVPFDRHTLYHAELRRDGTPYPKEMYTLRVCKSCRGDWLQAIERWYLDKPARDDDEGDA